MLLLVWEHLAGEMRQEVASVANGRCKATAVLPLRLLFVCFACDTSVEWRGARDASRLTTLSPLKLFGWEGHVVVCNG